MNDNRKFWDRFASIYEKVQLKNSDSKIFYAVLANLIMRQLKPEDTVLELAMGPGILTGRIAAGCRTLYATDYSEAMVNEAKKKELPDNVICEQADATNLCYGAGMFDAVIIANALHIMPDPDAAVSEIKRVLKPDGLLIAPTYLREKPSFKVKLMNLAGFKTMHSWTEETYLQFLENNGLEIIFRTLLDDHGMTECFAVCRKK